jgi:hypothetical protein
MLGDDFDPERVALVEDPPPDVVALLDGPAAEPAAPLRVARPNSDRITIDATLPRPALVVVSEQFFPGWEARVDGKPVALAKVNAVLMGVAVAEGSHHITLEFLPKPVILGVRLALATFGAIIVLFVVDTLRHRRRVQREVIHEPWREST